MSRYLHAPKLTRTACGKLLSPTISLLGGTPSTTYSIHSYRNLHLSGEMCYACCWTDFVVLWEENTDLLKHKYTKRFGVVPEMEFINDLAHQKTIKEFQDNRLKV